MVDGPFRVLERVNDNAYKLDLPGEYGASATFNVTDLSPFDAGYDSRMNPFEEGEYDVNRLTLTSRGLKDQQVRPEPKVKKERPQGRTRGLMRQTKFNWPSELRRDQLKGLCAQEVQWESFTFDPSGVGQEKEDLM